MKERRDAFNAHIPKVNESDVIEAVKAGRVAVSFGTHTVSAVDDASMAIRFTLGDGTVTRAIVLDLYDLQVLLLEALSAAGWTAIPSSKHGAKLN
jgi:hypothetical protein